MVKDINEYVKFDINTYLKEVSAIVPSSPTFHFQQTLDYVLPSIFIKMTGCIEHKIDMIMLQLCMDDEKYKKDKIRKGSRIPSGSTYCKDIISDIQKAISDLLNTHEKDYKAWEQYDDFDESMRILKLTLEETRLYSYLGNDFNCISLVCECVERLEKIKSSDNAINAYVDYGQFIKCLTTDLLLPNHTRIKLMYNIHALLKSTDSGSSDRARIIELKSDISKLNNEILTPIILYDKAIKFRNDYAHNENSVYTNTVSPSKLSNTDNIFDNWCFRFVSALYIDRIIRKKFKEYKEIKNKLLYI